MSHARQEAEEQVVAGASPTPDLAGPAAPVPVPLNALVVGHAEDAAEADADRMAETALRRLAAAGSGPSPREGIDRHRHDPSCGHLRRSPGATSSGALVGLEGGSLDGDTTAAVEAERGGGRPLDAPVLHRMQTAFSANLSGVRIHDDAESARLNRLVGARAFTTGRDVFFGTGEYDPSTAAGEKVLAHELAHTLQTSGSPVQRVAVRATAEAPVVPAGTIRRMRTPAPDEKVPSAYLLSGNQQAENYPAWAKTQWDKSVASAAKIAATLKGLVRDSKNAVDEGLPPVPVHGQEFALPAGADNWEVTVEGPSGTYKRVTIQYEHKTLEYAEHKKVGYKSTIITKNGKQELTANANYAPTELQKLADGGPNDKLLNMRLNQIWELQLAHYRHHVPGPEPVDDMPVAPRQLGKITRSKVENGQSMATVWLYDDFLRGGPLTDDDVMAVLGTPNGYGILHYVIQSSEFKQSNRLSGLDEGLADAAFLRSIVDVEVDKFRDDFNLIQTLRI